MRQGPLPGGTESAIGFDTLFDHVWAIRNPAPHASHTELICRVKKARWAVIALERGLSAIVCRECFYPTAQETDETSLQAPYVA